MPAKSEKKTSKSPEKSSATEAAPVKKSWLRWCLITGFKLSLVLLLSLFIYAIYLDSKVQKTFEGQRWQVPVQVYGKTPTISLGEPINLSQLKASLLLTGYNKVAQVNQVGEFAMSATKVELYRHSFNFGDHALAAGKVFISLKNGLVSQIIVNDIKVAEVELAPVLIDRILPQSKEDRVIVGLEQVPERLIDTLLLVEDRDYYFHHGVSPIGIARAFIANIKAGRTVQGGSTLTQQLVKNMFLTRHKTLWRKINEAIMALLLEYRYSKDQLLEAYINEVYLGQHYANGIYGFGLAAEFYFGKKIADLSTEQMATLVGQIKGPSYYDPWRYPERAIERRDLILTLMFEHDYLSKTEFSQAVKAPLSVRKSRRIVKQKQPAYLQLVKRELSELLSEQAQQSGVKVFTGFDIKAQKYLTDTIAKKLPEIERQTKSSDMEVAMMVTDHHTGEIVALSGGRDHQYAGFNRALNAQRPIGSLIKSVVYLAALERSDEYNLATKLADKPLAIEGENGEVWRPKNYDGKYRDEVNLYTALVRSLNVPTVNLGLALGLTPVANLLHILGYQDDVYMQPSMFLGAINMSPYEINQVYLPLASRGYRRESHAINKVVASNGEILWQHKALNEQILSAQASYLLNYSLHGVTTEGSAKSLTWRLPNAVVAGKTGTSNDQRDSWFIGYDNKYLITTWLGKDDNQTTKFTGSSGALVLYADLMNKLGVENLAMPVPSSIEEVWFNDETGIAYLSRCANSTPLPANIRDLVQRAKCTDKHEKDKNWFDRWFG